MGRWSSYFLFLQEQIKGIIIIIIRHASKESPMRQRCAVRIFVLVGHGQDDACQIQQHVVVLKDRSLDGFLHVAPIHLQVCRFLVCLRDLVILDGLQLRPLAPPASARPHCRFAPVVVLEASHLAPLAEHCCDKHRIAR
jgi:hypothetical protein